MMQYRSAVAALALLLPGLAATQTTATKPLAFEVASVKPSRPDARPGGIRPLSGGQMYVASGVPLRLMIKLMYKITDSQIVGGPGWMDTQLWDVNAKAERPSNLDELHEMFQTLLADRFQLRFHREKKEITAFVLTVDKSGSKLTRSALQDPFDIPIKGAGPGKIVGTRVPMSYFCWFLSQPLNVPVIDQTGLDGFYDFTLEAPPPSAEIALDRADYFDAIRRQLGLKLESRKAPVEVFVIDRAERPGEN